MPADSTNAALDWQDFRHVPLAALRVSDTIIEDVRVCAKGGAILARPISVRHKFANPRASRPEFGEGPQEDDRIGPDLSRNGDEFNDVEAALALAQTLFRRLQAHN